MLNPFICGTGTFNKEEEVDNSPCSSPRKSSRRKYNNKNPYSTRGLDKFSALLSDLDEKRQKIYSQVGSESISLVRFVYSNSNDCVPIVVKLRDKKEDKTKNFRYVKDNNHVSATHTNSEAVDKVPVENNTASLEEVKQPRLEISNEKTKIKKRFSWNMKLDNWRRPSYYLPVIIILILFFMALFGRSFAILCTSIGWYVVPTLKDSSNTTSSTTKKKIYVRRMSENYKMGNENMKEYRKSYSGSLEAKSPRKCGQRKC